MHDPPIVGTLIEAAILLAVTFLGGAVVLGLIYGAGAVLLGLLNGPAWLARLIARKLRAE